METFKIDFMCWLCPQKLKNIVAEQILWLWKTKKCVSNNKSQDEGQNESENALKLKLMSATGGCRILSHKNKMQNDGEEKRKRKNTQNA